VSTNIFVYPGENLAAILVAKKRIKLMALNDPVLTDYQVRVNIQESAICGTQLGEWNQTRGLDNYLPHCFGHEAVGYVLEVGRLVDDLQEGDRVVVTWMKTHGMTDSIPNFVEIASGKTVNFGECCTFIRRGVFPVNRIIKIDDFLENSTATLLGCAFLTAFAALKRATNGFTCIDREIAIVGSGGIGLAVALLAKAFNIPATCIDLPNVIDDLKNDNFEVEFLSTTESELNRCQYFPIVIICSGAVAAFELGEQLLQRNGGSMFIVGNPPFGSKVEFDVKPLLYGREIIGVGEKDVRLPEDIFDLVDLIKSGHLNANKLIRKSYTLSNINDAFKAASSGFGGRTVINIQY